MSKIDYSKLREPLPVESIDWRIQSINNGKYATILPYKDARVDMERLDDVVGPMNWKREHKRENHNCIVSIWDDVSKQWVSKEDTGTESMAEAKKGLASDSFKRACVNWGIGRELYGYPLISIQLSDTEVQPTGKDKPKYRASFKLDIKNWTWDITHNEGVVSKLVCLDSTGKTRFTWDKPLSAEELKKLQEEKQEAEQKRNEAEIAKLAKDHEIILSHGMESLNACKSMDDLGMTWTKYKLLQKDPIFVKTKNLLKDEMLKIEEEFNKQMDKSIKNQKSLTPESEIKG